MNNVKTVVKVPATFSSLENTIVLALLVTWLTYVAGLLVALTPYWALMDDHALRAGLLGTNVKLLEWLPGFVQGGMFRPSYGVFSYFFYKVFSSSSFQAYLFLYFVNILIFLMWGKGFVATAIQPKLSESSKNHAAWVALFVVLCFHFIRNNNLFYFASLQERAVIFFLGPAIILAAKPAKGPGTAAIPVVTLLLLTFGFLAKATAIVFLPLFSLWYFLKGLDCREARVPYLVSTALFVAVFLGVMGFFSSIREGYSAGYDFKYAFLELSNGQSKFYRILLLGLLTSALAIWNYFRTAGASEKESKAALQLFEILFWPLGAVAYAAIMLPWQTFLSYYLIIPVGMFSVGTKLILFNEMTALLNRWKRLPYGLFFIVGIALTSITPMWKFYQKAVHHHGTGKALEYLKGRFAGEGGRLTVRVAENCEETASALGNFLNRAGSTPMALGDDPFYTTPPVAGEKKLLVTHRECREFPETFAPRHEVFRYGEWVIYEQTA